MGNNMAWKFQVLEQKFCTSAIILSSILIVYIFCRVTKIRTGCLILLIRSEVTLKRMHGNMGRKAKVLIRRPRRKNSFGEIEKSRTTVADKNNGGSYNGPHGNGGFSPSGDSVDMSVQRARLLRDDSEQDILKSASHCVRYRDIRTSGEADISVTGGNVDSFDLIAAGDNALLKQDLTTSTRTRNSQTKETITLQVENEETDTGKDEQDSEMPIEQYVVSAVKAKRIGKFGDQHIDTAKDYYRTIDPFGILDCLGCLIAIFGFLADVGSDIFVSILYFNSEKWVWFGLTIGFVTIPAMVTTGFSIAWYIQDKEYYEHLGFPVSKKKWICRILFHILQIGPVLRYIDIMRFGLKSRLSKEADSSDRRKYMEIMLNEDADTALLRLLECFMEAAPQLTLQLYILCRYGGDSATLIRIGQGVSCVTSLASLAWALTAYHKSLRLSLHNKAKLSYVGMALQFVWRFLTVGCRVLAFALFASQLTILVFVVAGCHWVVMFLWVLMQKTAFCDVRMRHAKCQEVFFNMVVAAVYVYCFINVSEGHTRLRYVIYYCIVYTENVGMCLFWYMFAHTGDSWYLEPALALILGGFFIGLLFQVIYYRFFHPNNYPTFSKENHIRCCLSCDEMMNRQSRDENENPVSANLLNGESAVPRPIPSQFV